jgi:hypothetical protein
MMNDDEMKEVLREWHAPVPPPDLEARVWERKAAARGLRWLLNGQIRIPVPAFLLAIVLLAALFFAVRRPEPRTATRTGLSGFQPVKQFTPRIVGNNYEVH